MAEPPVRFVDLPVKRLLAVVVGLGLSLVFLYFSCRGIVWDAFVRELSQVSIPILLLSQLTKGAAFLCGSARARILLRQLYAFRLWRLFKAHLLLFVANNVFPFRLGELVRIHYLAIHSQLSHTSCLAVAVTERLLDVAVVFLFLLGMITFIDRLPLVSSVYLLLVGVVGGTALAMWISRYPQAFVHWVARLTRPLGRAVSGFVQPKSVHFAQGLSGLASFRTAVWVMAATVGFWSMQMASARIWIWAWHLDLPWYAPMTIILFLALGTAIPSSPGYIGTYHFFATSALVYLGVARTTALSFAVVAHVMAVVPFTLWGLVVVFLDYTRGELFSWPTLRSMLIGRR